MGWNPVPARTLGTTTPEAMVFARREWRRSLEALDEELVKHLAGAYEGVLTRLKRDHASLLNELLARWEAGGGNITAEEVRGLPTYGRLMARLQAEMVDFSAMAREYTENETEWALSRGIMAAESQLLALDEGLAGRLFRPAPEAVARAAHYVGGPAFYDKWKQFGTEAPRLLGDVYLTGVAQGRNPRELARLLSQWLEIPRAWAANSARTTLLWSFRTANHEYFRANSHLIRGWLWSAACDARTCPVCWAMDGTQHTLDETLNGHHQCRCAPVPIVATAQGELLAKQYGTGPEKFAKLNPIQQRDVLGPGRLALLQKQGQNKFWKKMRGATYDDSVFGPMVRAKTLGELGAGRISLERKPKPSAPPPPSSGEKGVFSWRKPATLAQWKEWATKVQQGEMSPALKRQVQASLKLLAEARVPIPYRTKRLILEHVKGDTRLGRCSLDGGIIHINASFDWEHFGLHVRQAAAGHWWPTGASHGVTLVHEMGHALHFDKVGRVKALAIKDMTLEQQAIAARVSAYAEVNGLEFVAETFTGLVFGQTYDEEVMKQYRAFGGLVPGESYKPFVEYREGW